jgi:hypothetical protein
MGMDIFGKNPTLVGVKPEIDFVTASKEAKEEYFAEMDKWESNNPGYYFRANLWSWRPIQMIINQVNLNKDLGIDTSEFGYNSGAGLDTAEECIILADALVEFMENADLDDSDDRIYLCLGMWVSQEGGFSVPEEITEDLNKQFSMGKLIQGGVVGNDGNLYYPAWSTSNSHMREFITFLRNCGGFQIW